MSEQLKIEQPNFYQNVIVPLQKNKKVQHAYLVETNFIENKEQYILEFVEQLFLLKLDSTLITKEQLHEYILNNSFPDLKILKTKNSVIKKEELLELKDSFRDKSIYGGYQIYIIYDAEKLNVSSANTILKFLEEPEENIIAVLVTNNRYQMLETILSRCQILSFTNSKKYKNVNFSSATQKLIQLISQRKNEDLMISHSLILTEIFSSKEDTLNVLQELINFYSYLLQNFYQIGGQYSDFILNYKEKFSEEEILQILAIIETKKQELEYNLNLKVWIDSFLLNLMEV